MKWNAKLGAFICRNATSLITSPQIPSSIDRRSNGRRKGKRWATWNSLKKNSSCKFFSTLDVFNVRSTSVTSLNQTSFVSSKIPESRRSERRDTRGRRARGRPEQEEGTGTWTRRCQDELVWDFIFVSSRLPQTKTNNIIGIRRNPSNNKLDFNFFTFNQGE